MGENQTKGQKWEGIIEAVDRAIRPLGLEASGLVEAPVVEPAVFERGELVLALRPMTEVERQGGA